jgi:hypothetical protein
MATVAQWIEGARPRTLPNAVAPVIAGTGAAAWLGSWLKVQSAPRRQPSSVFIYLQTRSFFASVILDISY